MTPSHHRSRRTGAGGVHSDRLEGTRPRPPKQVTALLTDTPGSPSYNPNLAITTIPTGTTRLPEHALPLWARFLRLVKLLSDFSYLSFQDISSACVAAMLAAQSPVTTISEPRSGQGGDTLCLESEVRRYVAPPG